MIGKFGSGVFRGNGSTYLRIGFKKAPNEFVGDGNIFVGASMFSIPTLSSDSYEGEFEISQFYLIGGIARTNI